MRTINVQINGEFITKDNKNGGVQGEGNATQLHLVFDNTWEGYGKRVIWRDAQGENPVAVILANSVTEMAEGANSLEYNTPIPSEPLKYPGWCSFTIEGYQDSDPASVALTVSDNLKVWVNDTFYTPAEPTPSQAQQIMAAIEEIVPDMQELALEAKSWAVGNTGTREGEDTDNAKYYAQSASSSAASAATDAASALNSKNTAEQAKESAAASAADATSAAEQASASATAAANAVGKTSYIGDNGNWFEWNSQNNQFVDSGRPATALVDSNSGQQIHMWFGTIEEYNGLSTIDSKVYYNILEGTLA